MAAYRRLNAVETFNLAIGLRPTMTGLLHGNPELLAHLATAAEPDVPARLSLEIRNETSRVPIDPPDRGRGGQGLMADHVPGRVRIGAAGRPTSSAG